MKFIIDRLNVTIAITGAMFFVAPLLPTASPAANAVGSEQTNVAQLRKQVGDAKVVVLTADMALKKVTDQAKELRSKLEEEYDTNPMMQAARKQLEEHKATLDQYKTPILEKLQQQPDYRSKTTERDDARKKLKSKEFSLAVLAIKKMASDAIEANPQANVAQAAVTVSEAKVRELVERHRANMLQDERVVAVRAEIDKAKTTLAQSRQRMAAEQHSLVIAEQKLAQAQARARQASQARRPAPRRR